jgi:hypothetical protein
MIGANITNETRKAVYRRENFRCALCDGEAGLQIHHVIPRGQGGTDFPHNLIALCWRCHATAHGTHLPEYDGVTSMDIAQACVEYLSDYYADLGLVWNPWEKQMRRIE